MSGKVTANINIAGRIYPMSVEAKEEEIFKKAEALIKDKVGDYDKYPDKDMQDVLAIILFNVTAQLLEYQKLNDSRCSEIEKIDRDLGIYLEKQGSLDNIE
ncbi:MAG: cell division protein ZapA [Prevotellaceae bacterium]|jgi:cell division protein ZapA|nr:cell division protein ZapA [Prevotellaceae bacterium]